ncbi:MAG TPA: metallophosphoesterase [Gemmataceae bacterium]|nr:metallophosphoesterase [Gemmataceae bacterium]
MSSMHAPVVCVIPGDLHLTEPGLDNHRTARWMIEEVNHLVHPDFVQFIGDNVQHAEPEQFMLFRDLCDRLQVPWHALVGDHDVHDDDEVHGFRAFVGEPYGSYSLRGFRFIRLNTLEHRPLGLTQRQIDWFCDEVDQALAAGERVVVFQHHYPFKVCETFDGPGIDAWREVVQTRRIAAIFTGHTHYGQIANDGRNVAVTTRSIGDPEGGSPGYSIVYLQGDGLAVTYRAIADEGPIALVIHPRDRLLATEPKHIVRGADRCRVKVWSFQPVGVVRGCFDEGHWFALERESASVWSCPLPGDQLGKGAHTFEVQAIDAAGRACGQEIRFQVDPTGRYTPVPGVRPPVASTAFC